MMQSAHGKFKISVNENQISTKLLGSYNTQGIEAWISEMKKTISSFSGAPFTILVDEIGAKGATPQALAKGNEYNEWLNHQNLVAKAVIYGESIYKEIDNKSLPARAKQNIKFFETVEDAQCWLLEQWKSSESNK